MARIEEYWEDIIIYYVEFSVATTEKTIRIHHKMLVFPMFMQKDKVREMMNIHFSNIVDILAIDIIDEGLLLKDREINKYRDSQ